MAQPKLNQKDVSQLNDLAVFFSFKYSDIGRKFFTLPHKVIASFTGNQFGKTCHSTYSTVLSILGRHPVVEKNLDYYVCKCGKKWNANKVPKDGTCPCGGMVELYSSPIRVIRFCSETLPGETMDGKGEVSTEVRNTLFPEFIKWCPAFLIKKNITARSPKMIVHSGIGGPDIVVEFVSYGQSVQSTAGSQRWKIVCDEEPPKAFWDEQLPRLLAADGWLELTLTPANFITWTHDEIFDRASVYCRSKTVSEKFGLKEFEKVRDDNQIAVIQAATDDNATLRPDVVERLFENFPDPDVLAIRRYGIFKQVSGRIFKQFDWGTHIIDEFKYFPDGIPQGDGMHCRGIDYHGRTPWAIGWLYLSDADELFIYDEYNPSPEQNTTEAIAREMAERHTDHYYKLNLCDPLIKSAQIKPNWTVLDDLNHAFSRIKKAGIGTGGYWEVWDTKSERGRDAIKARLKNSILCGHPFNNVQMRDGVETKLPTIWIFSRCKLFANSFKNWRWEEWANAGNNAVKEEKNTPQQKWSHFCMVVEGVLKDIRFRPRSRTLNQREFKDDPYFRRERVHG